MLFWQLKQVMELVSYVQSREEVFSFKWTNVFAMKVKFGNL